MTLAGFRAAFDGWMQAHAARDELDVSEAEYASVLAEEIAAGRA